MSQTLLIVATSGRALAAAARRGGYDPVVLDLFNDMDTRVLARRSKAVAGSIEEGFDAEALCAAAEAEPDLPLVYGAGFEDRPALLARLAAGRRLYGNAPETLARIKDPASFFALLDRLGIPHPEVALTPPEDRADWPGGWLVKRIGGAGGSHVRPARTGVGHDAGHYFQRYGEGRPVSALFLANGRTALTLGFSLQWRAPGRGLGFLFGGAAQPARFEPAIAETIQGLLPRLVAETGLVGLNSADFLIRPDRFDLLELNPRPGATLDIFDRPAHGSEGEERGLLALHLAACEGRLPETWWTAQGAAGCAVLYAPRDLVVPRDFRWPDWAADLPEGGSVIPAGAPLCTLLAEGSEVDSARRLVEQRSGQILRAIEHPGAAALSGAA